MRFVKLHGLGNDFVVLDRRTGGTPLTSAAVMALCDRHRGIGADGVLSVWNDGHGDVRMEVQNSDGSDAGMCGNGIRCVARFLWDRDPPRGDVLEVDVLGEVYPCRRESANRFVVDMGEAKAVEPLNIDVQLGGESRSLAGTRVLLGNPHFVVAVADSEEPLEVARRFGPLVERHDSFPDRVNASFIKPRSDGFDAVVFERGVGMTQACGSGACAVGVAATNVAAWPAGEPMRVHLPGGPLTITVTASRRISMAGDAVPVFVGDVDVDALNPGGGR